MLSGNEVHIAYSLKCATLGENLSFEFLTKPDSILTPEATEAS